jgi:hypothetical protein
VLALCLNYLNNYLLNNLIYIPNEEKSLKTGVGRESFPMAL